MREHAIPQDITGYRFHIIGNMTIKQFAEIGAGVLVGFLIYTTNLPIFIKWPCIILAGAIGAGAAFVPIEERPLDHWITTFFKVLYKPTKFFWRREPKVPEPFLYKTENEAHSMVTDFDLKPARRERIKEYLRSVETPQVVNQFDQTETSRLDAIMGTFESVVVVTPDIEPAAQKPNLKIRVRSLIVNQADPVALQAVTPVPEATKLINPPSLPGLTAVVEPEPEVVAAATYNPLTTQQVASNLEIPQTPTITYQASATPELSAPATAAGLSEVTATVDISAPQELPDSRAYVVNTSSQPVVTTTQVAVTNADLPFPEMPTIPNKVVGMILRPNNELINDAIVEIQTADGRVVRAVKSNALGQFFITTPLDNGTYTLLVEREGFEFIPQQLVMDGSVLAPVEIRSLA